MPLRPPLPAIPAVGGLGLGLLVVARTADGLPVGDRVVGPALGPRDYVVSDGGSTEALRSADLATMVRASEDDSTEPLLLGRARSRPTPTPIVVAPRHRPLLSPVRRGTVPSRGVGTRLGTAVALSAREGVPRSRPDGILPDARRAPESSSARRPEPVSSRSRESTPPVTPLPEEVTDPPPPAPGPSYSGPRGRPEAGQGGQSSLGPGGLCADPGGRVRFPRWGVTPRGSVTPSNASA